MVWGMAAQASGVGPGDGGSNKAGDIRLRWDDLLTPCGPWLHVTVANESELCSAMWALQSSHQGRITARMIRGQKSTTYEDFMNEIAAALQFPYYFGANWPALGECLADLEWLPQSEAYVLFIANAHRLFETEVEADTELRVLVEILNHTGKEWNKPQPEDPFYPRGAIAFHVVFHAQSQDFARLRARLDTVGAAYADLHLA